jgi:hypothetical protein
MECDSQHGLRVQMIGAAQNSEPCKEKNAEYTLPQALKTTFSAQIQPFFNGFSRGEKTETAQ